MNSTLFEGEQVRRTLTRGGLASACDLKERGSLWVYRRQALRRGDTVVKGLILLQYTYQPIYVPADPAEGYQTSRVVKE